MNIKEVIIYLNIIKKNNNIFLCVIDLNYYQNAINYIIDKVNNPVFFVSDDLDWARDNLIFLSDVVYIDYKDKS